MILSINHVQFSKFVHPDVQKTLLLNRSWNTNAVSSHLIVITDYRVGFVGKSNNGRKYIKKALQSTAKVERIVIRKILLGEEDCFERTGLNVQITRNNLTLTFVLLLILR